ncbi:Flagellar basal body-associated protein FliL [Sulfitobacter brevis]|uniref:Flagellar protein FliL n=1 Tax=Sulfitobacter brevis TaxID=74348 RepID=A0A1I2DY22_9RHOB|nr:flagellar basal body-associated FliL family protein [Sulfitobacter brevis]SFE85534.1 Flagellar basal body-associated protein FliL [Sulfitobacter brevis]
MAKKPSTKAKPDAETGDSPAAAKGSKKTLLAAAVLCLLSLGGGFVLARMAYVKDAEAFEPDYANDAEHEGEDAGHGEASKPDLRKDITDPLAQDGHDAENAMSLKAKETDPNAGLADTGLLDFGDVMTNIQSFDAQGLPKTSFLKVNLVVAYRPDAGSGQLMQSREPFMRDLFNGYLRGLSEADVRGMAGILYIKAELLKRARAAVGNDMPQEILINDLIVQ